MDYNIIQMDKNTWRIENNGVRFFLLTGDKLGLVIDSGMTTNNAKEIAGSLTELPLRLINTHADMDHIAGNDAFDTAYMHPSEYVNYMPKGTAHPEPTPVWDEDVIDLGGRHLRVLFQPGHTPGSIALLDTERRVLYSADSIQNGDIFMFGPMRNATAYRQSLDRIWAHREEFDIIYPSHADLPLKPDHIPLLMECMDQILTGKVPFERDVMFGMPVRKYNTEAAVFLMDD